MSIKIEFNAETPAKAHEEMVEFARLFLGAPVTEARKPYVPTERIPVLRETTNTVIPLEVAPEATEATEATEEAEDTKPPVKEEKKRTTTAKKTTKTAPAAKEETPVVPVETKEETPADTNDGAETGSDAGAATSPNNYGPGFEDCSNDVEVMTKVRALVNTFNLKGRPNANFAKKVFASYGVATMLKLSTEQAIEMYGRLINATEEDINQE